MIKENNLSSIADKKWSDKEVQEVSEKLKKSQIDAESSATKESNSHGSTPFNFFRSLPLKAMINNPVLSLLIKPCDLKPLSFLRTITVDCKKIEQSSDQASEWPSRVIFDNGCLFSI